MSRRIFTSSPTPTQHCTKLIFYPTLLSCSLQKGKGACIRSAAIGDVVEVSYQVRIAGDESNGGQGQLIDGAKVLATQGD